MATPDIRTTVLGSYPVPAWLRAQPSRVALRDAVMVVIKTQELAGLDLLADGELGRFDVNHPDTNGMIEYFVRPLGGVGADLTREEIADFRAQQGMGFRTQPAGVVRGEIGEGTLNLPGDWAFVRGLSERPMKFTVTSPYMLARTLLDTHYGDRRALTMAVAEALRRQVAAIDAPVVQVDEANVPGTPEDAALAAEAINHVLSGVQNERAVHLCFGNYGGQTIQKGLYRDMLGFLNALECDHVALELARRDPAELEILSDLKAGVAFGIGVIDIKDNAVETPDAVARRIQAAADALGLDRIRYVHPDCGFWMLVRSVADRKMAALVRGRDRFVNG